jgi:adenylate cyclase
VRYFTSVQDRITASVVGAIQPSVRSAEIERSRRKRPESLDAYDLVLRAYPNVWSLERAILRPSHADWIRVRGR